MDLLKNYESLWKGIIRPSRQAYNLTDLGPVTNLTRDTKEKIKRIDFQLSNKKGMLLKCSFYQFIERKIQPPCVIYLHCNSGSRLEGQIYASSLVNQGMSACVFDFAGCGQSEGEYISLGHFELGDVEVVVNYLKLNWQITKIAVWGRSMGAVTGLMYIAHDQSIVAGIFDSPFSNFMKLAVQIGKRKTGMPKFLVKGALSIVQSTIQEKAGFDIEELNLLKTIDRCKAPCLFIASKQDNFVKCSHSEKLQKQYPGESKIIYFEGDHNEQRPGQTIKECIDFLQSKLLINNDEVTRVARNHSLQHQPLKGDYYHSQSVQQQVNARTRICSVQLNQNMAVQPIQPGSTRTTMNIQENFKQVSPQNSQNLRFGQNGNLDVLQTRAFSQARSSAPNIQTVYENKTNFGQDQPEQKSNQIEHQDKLYYNSQAFKQLQSNSSLRATNSSTLSNSISQQLPNTQKMEPKNSGLKEPNSMPNQNYPQHNDFLFQQNIYQNLAKIENLQFQYQEQKLQNLYQQKQQSQIQHTTHRSESIQPQKQFTLEESSTHAQDSSSAPNIHKVRERIVSSITSQVVDNIQKNPSAMKAQIQSQYNDLFNEGLRAQQYKQLSNTNQYSQQNSGRLVSNDHNNLITQYTLPSSRSKDVDQQEQGKVRNEYLFNLESTQINDYQNGIHNNKRITEPQQNFSQSQKEIHHPQNYLPSNQSIQMQTLPSEIPNRYRAQTTDQITLESVCDFKYLETQQDSQNYQQPTIIRNQSLHSVEESTFQKLAHNHSKQFELSFKATPLMKVEDFDQGEKLIGVEQRINTEVSNSSSKKTNSSSSIMNKFQPSKSILENYGNCNQISFSGSKNNHLPSSNEKTQSNLSQRKPIWFLNENSLNQNGQLSSLQKQVYPSMSSGKVQNKIKSANPIVKAFNLATHTPEKVYDTSQSQQQIPLISGFSTQRKEQYPQQNIKEFHYFKSQNQSQDEQLQSQNLQNYQNNQEDTNQSYRDKLQNSNQKTPIHSQQHNSASQNYNQTPQIKLNSQQPTNKGIHIAQTQINPSEFGLNCRSQPIQNSPLFQQYQQFPQFQNQYHQKAHSQSNSNVDPAQNKYQSIYPQNRTNLIYHQSSNNANIQNINTNNNNHNHVNTNNIINIKNQNTSTINNNNNNIINNINTSNAFSSNKQITGNEYVLQQFNLNKEKSTKKKLISPSQKYLTSQPQTQGMKSFDEGDQSNILNNSNNQQQNQISNNLKQSKKFDFKNRRSQNNVPIQRIKIPQKNENSSTTSYLNENIAPSVLNENNSNMIPSNQTNNQQEQYHCNTNLQSKFISQSAQKTSSIANIPRETIPSFYWEKDKPFENQVKKNNFIECSLKTQLESEGLKKNRSTTTPNFQNELVTNILTQKIEQPQQDYRNLNSNLIFGEIQTEINQNVSASTTTTGFYKKNSHNIHK